MGAEEKFSTVGVDGVKGFLLWEYACLKEQVDAADQV
jgi:hypothetical protein